MLKRAFLFYLVHHFTSSYTPVETGMPCLYTEFTSSTVYKLVILCTRGNMKLKIVLEKGPDGYIIDLLPLMQRLCHTGRNRRGVNRKSERGG